MGTPNCIHTVYISKFGIPTSSPSAAEVSLVKFPTDSAAAGEVRRAQRVAVWLEGHLENRESMAIDVEFHWGSQDIDSAVWSPMTPQYDAYNRLRFWV